MKYLPDSKDARYSDILDAILEKDINLAIGDAMLRTREYFDNGTSGISSLVQQHPEPAVVQSIMATIENFDGDGRIFRDCEFNYSVMFARADQALYADYIEVSAEVDK